MERRGEGAGSMAAGDVGLLPRDSPFRMLTYPEAPTTYFRPMDTSA